MSFEFFFLIHQVCVKWTTENSILPRSMILNAQILDPII